MNNRRTGAINEDWAAVFLEQNGVKIIERNFRFHKIGEIDLIGRDKEYLVFFEVKYRKTAKAGFAAEAVNYKKIIQICKVANCYRMVRKISPDTPVRFDVVAMDGTNIHWIKNAFDYAL